MITYVAASVTYGCSLHRTRLQASEPIALYLGELTDELSLEGEGKADNTYLYALSLEEMKSRGYKASAQLRVDASKAGAEARFINDCWAPPGLPARTPNCYLELLFCGQAKQFHLVFFASARIKKGHEIIANYGPEFWRVASTVLLEAHAQAAAAGSPPSVPATKVTKATKAAKAAKAAKAGSPASARAAADESEATSGVARKKPRTRK